MTASGPGDVVLGARETSYASYINCPASKVGFQPGSINVDCDQLHYFSMHSGGGNFVFGDGSVRFVAYSANSVLPQLCTRAAAGHRRLLTRERRLLMRLPAALLLSAGYLSSLAGCGGNEPVPTSNSTRPSRLPRPEGG
jgi:prepilin-type processing-associated H-X9-DG protein